MPLWFKELANIYIEGVDKDMIDKFINGKLSQEELLNDWEQEVTSNQLETVIEEIIMIAEKQNESLDLLLALAARNSRNNHARYIKATIKQEDYNRERNQITVGILALIKNFGRYWPSCNSIYRMASSINSSLLIVPHNPYGRAP